MGENAGRGVFTTADIVEGSYIMLEASTQQLRFYVQSCVSIYNTREMLQKLFNEEVGEEQETDGTDDDDDDDEELRIGLYELNIRKGEMKFEIDSLLTFMEGLFTGIRNHRLSASVFYFYVAKNHTSTVQKKNKTGYGFDWDSKVSFCYYWSLIIRLIL